MPTALVWSRSGSREQLRLTAEKAEGGAWAEGGSKNRRPKAHRGHGLPVLGKENPGTRRHERWTDDRCGQRPAVQSLFKTWRPPAPQ